MPDNDNDNVPSGDLAGIAIPTISEVLAAYLAEEKARLKPDTYDLYADVIELLQATAWMVTPMPRWKHTSAPSGSGTSTRTATGIGSSARSSGPSTFCQISVNSWAIS